MSGRPSLTPSEVSLWLSVTEDTLFLHDGLLKVSNLVQVPRGAGSQVEVSSAHARLLEYRLNAVRGLWEAQRSLAGHSEPTETAKEPHHEEGGDPAQASFSSRVSLLLIFPLLQSQSEIDPALCGVSANLLLNCLRECPPLSLHKEPPDCLAGLEALLSSWLGEGADGRLDPESAKVRDKAHQETVVSALVALACARGTLSTFLHVIYLLQKLPNLSYLQVSGVLRNLSQLEGSARYPSAILGPKHVLGWAFDDLLRGGDQDHGEGSRSVTCDGSHLYLTKGQGISKVGTGLHGTLRGFVYTYNSSLGAGRVAYARGCLLFRPLEFDREPECHLLGIVLDAMTLRPEGRVAMPKTFSWAANRTTVHFCSDGCYFYLVSFVPHENPGGPQPIYLDVFAIQGGCEEATLVQNQVVLRRKEETTSKSLNEALMSHLRPFRPLLLSSAASSSAPAGQDSAGVTSCGVSLKNLLKCPIYTCGNSLVILSTVPGSASSSALFGSSSALRVLASNLVFRVTDGHFQARLDLLDAPFSSLAKGSSLYKLGACYDCVNNAIWLCSGDHADQFDNPGHLAAHHVHRRLGADASQLGIPDHQAALSPVDVIRQLLHHVGSMCCHQLACDLQLRTKKRPADRAFLTWAVSILEVAVASTDLHLVGCSLAVLQVAFRTLDFAGDEGRLLGAVFNILQKLVAEPGAVRAQACKCLVAGLEVLYPRLADRNNMVLGLLTACQDDGVSALLRDLVLEEFIQNIDRFRLPEKAVHYLLKIAVKDSCVLLRKCATGGHDHFDRILLSVPVFSPCCRYLATYQNFMLKNLLLDPLSEDGPPVRSIQLYASHVFAGAYEVLEVLLEVCHTLIGRESGTELEWRLQGLERVVKSTVLGSLLPTLVTAMAHPSLQGLEMADALMPQLVQLVILTSKAALLLKNQVQAIKEGDLLVSPDSDVLQLIGESLPLESNGDLPEEEAGFLAGLKIPTPWAVGRTVESIHPLRDNYKFKETVHIAGAQCLYLQFDPSCSSQYDYDKLVVYAGPSVTSKKVAEYGGNTFGFGSRTVLGSGWPKDLVRVEGDTVTFSFEMRSSREDNTPDKAMWGFLVHVRAQESAEDASGGLPFLADMALGLLVVSCSLLQCLYQGPPTCQDEVICQHLLRSPLLQRCLWQTASVDRTPETAPGVPSLPLSRIKLTPERLRKLRELSGQPPLQLRPSIREILRPDVLEELVLSAVIKHLELFPLVRQMKGERLRRVVSETYARLHALLRRLQMLAELEQQWQTEVEDVVKGAMPAHMSLFAMHHLMESQAKELALLCFLKDVAFDPLNLDAAIHTLRQKLECEAAAPEGDRGAAMATTRKLVQGIIERTELLLSVTVRDEAEGLETRSDPATATSPSSARQKRSMSVPCSTLEETFDDWRKKQQRSQDEECPCALLDQLFSFIGSSPEKSVSCRSFLSAAEVRFRRGTSRRKALVHMKELLVAASQVGGATHLVSAVTSVLQQGPKTEELTCGGEEQGVQEAFSETLTLVVQLVAKYPRACIASVGMLCAVPYTRLEEKCLVRSGLVHLLDHLCCFYQCSTESRRRMADLAWAGFQVLATRCAHWEEMDAPHSRFEHSGLARQVSLLLSNHLSRATDPKNNDAFAIKSLSEVLHLLDSLSKSKMGKAILSQPGCVSKLLSLLLDQRPSPKLVLTVLHLLHVALPLMSSDDCARIAVPPPNVDVETICPGIGDNDRATHVVCLLLAKLGDFVLTGALTGPFCLARKGSDPTSASSKTSPGTASGAKEEKVEDSDIKDGKLSVFLHKRADQHTHEVIQPLLSLSSSGPDARILRSTMERVLKMEREISKYGKAEICTEDAVIALRCAARWAQNGLVISTGPPVEGMAAEQGTDKKKMGIEAICREKNAELAKTDPVRPFISGHVANGMASEIVGLLHSLLEAPDRSTATMWAGAVDKVVGSSVSLLPLVLSENLAAVTPTNLWNLLAKARQVTAALCALGGFKESLKPGSRVVINGEGICESHGQVVSVCEERGMATVRLHFPEDGHSHPRISDTVHVPLSRLKPPRCKPLPIRSEGPLLDQVVSAMHALLVPDDGRPSPLQVPTPQLQQETPSALVTMCRAAVEIQARACQVLFHLVQNPFFSERFMRMSARAIDVLKLLAKECPPGERRDAVESLCERFRMLFFDCAKPPPPPARVAARSKEITWHPSRAFPPVRASLFSHGMSGITFLGDPSAGPGLPRGTFVYATQAIPPQAPSFYWEIEICSYGESHDDGGPLVSFGFAPPAERKEGAWTNPVGTVLLHNNGRAVHYNGSSLLQWKSVRLDVAIRSGDVTGCGWEKQGDGQGTVFFTHNGRLLPATLDNVSAGMWPVVHIQKKNTRIRANFGGRPFAYEEGQQHRSAADDDTDEISANFGLLPFHGTFDAADLAGGREAATPPGCSWMVSPPQRGYNSAASSAYKLSPSFDVLLATGPDPHPPPLHEEADDSVEDENLYALLVKAWESKVFPVIRRRFRNEGERKDGLEQIKGALQLGMTDIARQTVEFLYEENGGIPRDLHLPTIEDIKEDLAKFTIDNLKKGATVAIRSPPSALPKFAVPELTATFGLMGQVLDIDTQNELVQVETYLRHEGMLVRYWYPLDVLEKPPDGGYGHAGVGDSLQLHGDLLRLEATLTRMFCRSAFLELTAAASELDVENLHLLSDELLASNADRGHVVERSISSCQNLDRCLDSLSTSPSRLFYAHGPTATARLGKALASAIRRAGLQGEDYLLELTNQMCLCLQLAPENFPYECRATSESADVGFPEAAFLVVSCKTDTKQQSKKEAKSPWARVFCQHIKRNGQLSKLEVLRYPLADHVADPYTSIVLAGNSLELAISASPPPGMCVVVHAIPPELPLALAYVEELLDTARTDRDHRIVTPLILCHLVELICGYLAKTNVPPLLKERVFHLLAEAVRVADAVKRTCDAPSVEVPLVGSYYDALGAQLLAELRCLYEEETKRWPSVDAVVAALSLPSGSANGRFSSYFQSLVEVCLAFSEAQAPELVGASPTSLPTSPPSSNRRKKLRTRRGKQPPPQSADSAIPRSKSDDLLWFQRVLATSLVLRNVAFGDANGASVAQDAMVEANAALRAPSAHTRLLVITGIPQHMSCENAKQAIRKAFQGVGGLYRNELFVPEGSTTGKVKGYAVVELRSQAKVEVARRSICKGKLLLSKLSLEPNMHEEDLIELSEDVAIATVDPQLRICGGSPDGPLEHYLVAKVLCPTTDLTDAALIAVTEIFHSCFERGLEASVDQSGYVCLGKPHILNPSPGNILHTFFVTLSPAEVEKLVDSVLRSYGILRTMDKEGYEPEKQLACKSREAFSKESTPEDLDVLAKDWEKCESESTGKDAAGIEACPFVLTLDGFIQFVVARAQDDVRTVWQAFLACGYDLHFDRFRSIDCEHALQLMQSWTTEMDASLVHLVNVMCRSLVVTPSQIHPHEIFLSQAERASFEYFPLRDIPVESLRVRFSFLQSLNAMLLQSLFLLAVDLRPSYPSSTSSLLSASRSLVFYDTKLTFTNYVLDLTDQRKPDQVAPEIVLDPLQGVGVENRRVENTHFCQAMRQLQSVPSSQLCVRLASGGDPTYAFVVRYTGEEVHGTSGSFRHFLSHLAQELQGPLLSLLVSSPGSSLQRCGFHLKPGPVTFAEEQMLVAFGQLLGVAVRADIPLALDMSPCFWKSLLAMPLSTLSDLQEGDVVTYKFIKELAMVSSESEFKKVLEEHQNPTFIYHSANGDVYELCPGGERIRVSWENQEEFVQLLKARKLEDLEARQRAAAVRAGFASVVPLPLLALHTPQDLEMRVCGLPEIDLEFLKLHTMYQVGLTETDAHIQFFWNALEGFSQDELCKFVKFACNQDRIPNVCPCRSGKSDATHVPPYPMKIAPPDGRSGSPDSRFIRAETCMFMVKLPQYSTQEIMTERLLYSIHCREDPLSG